MFQFEKNELPARKRKLAEAIQIVRQFHCQREVGKVRFASCVLGRVFQAESQSKTVDNSKGDAANRLKNGFRIV